MTEPIAGSFVIGTAGHIDHGKSTLVKALTQIDPDRLEEEKRRGMTIDLGFAYLLLPSGRRVGHGRRGPRRAARGPRCGARANPTSARRGPAAAASRSFLRHGRVRNRRYRHSGWWCAAPGCRGDRDAGRAPGPDPRTPAAQ